MLPSTGNGNKSCGLSESGQRSTGHIFFFKIGSTFLREITQHIQKHGNIHKEIVSHYLSQEYITVPSYITNIKTFVNNHWIITT